MLSYHADADIHTNPFELCLDRLVNLDIEANFIGKSSLRSIKAKGVERKQVGLVLDGAPLTGPNTSFWAITDKGKTIGKVTSAVFSPRLQKNIALAMVSVDRTALGTELRVLAGAEHRTALVVERPFFDPKKKITASALSN